MSTTPAAKKPTLSELFAAAAKGELVTKASVTALEARLGAMDAALKKNGVTLADDATAEAIESAISGKLTGAVTAGTALILLSAASGALGVVVPEAATAAEVTKLFGDAVKVKETAAAEIPGKKLTNLTTALSAKGVKLPDELADDKAPAAIGMAVDLRLGALLADAMLAQGFDPETLPGQRGEDPAQPGEHLAEYNRLLATDSKAAGEYYAAHKNKILTN